METIAPIESFSLLTQRGNAKIHFNGRLFRLQRQVPNLNADGSKSYYYKCCTSKCLGRLVGYCSAEEVIEDISNYKHDESSHSNFCIKDVNAIMVEKARKKCSSLVTSGAKRGYSAAMGAVVGELVNKIGIEAAAQFPCASTGKRAVHRDMQKILGHPPSAFSGLNNSIPEQFGFTKLQQRFLLVFESFIDDNAVDCGPIIIFATKSDLRKLFAATLIAVDGTFKIKPKPYAVVRGAQVLTINTFFGVAHSRRLYRRVLAIMPRKTKVLLPYYFFFFY
jgi:hypothetical protein